MTITIGEAGSAPAGSWMHEFEIAAGSVQGTEHQRLGRNNQDAYYISRLPEAVTAIVSDGCGAGDHSEVGAQFGVHLTANRIYQQLKTQPAIDWSRLRAEILEDLKMLVTMIGGSPSSIEAYLLFTLVGAVITPYQVTIFSVGDGVYSLNHQLIELGPFEQNAPPYLAYGIRSAELSLFQVHHQLPLAQFKSLLVGTDGVVDLIKHSHQSLPGQSQLVGSISQFWLDDRYFSNPDQLRRQLSLINRSVVQPDWESRCLHKIPGLLTDDTTLIVIRRKETP